VLTLSSMLALYFGYAIISSFYSTTLCNMEGPCVGDGHQPLTPTQFGLNCILLAFLLLAAFFGIRAFLQAGRTDKESGRAKGENPGQGNNPIADGKPGVGR
ncbi:MAG: hypothetical protein JWN03_9126, partial [Nocardia sp.]|uniref:hypothetical protein n=1 Tax=Nocardia sp. TaxID=1821 RepID=UPI0026322544